MPINYIDISSDDEENAGPSGSQEGDPVVSEFFEIESFEFGLDSDPDDSSSEWIDISRDDEEVAGASGPKEADPVGLKFDEIPSEDRDEMVDHFLFP